MDLVVREAALTVSAASEVSDAPANGK